MSIAGYTTSVGVPATVAAVEKMLAKSGASSITKTYGPDGICTGLEFRINTEYGWVDFKLPVRADGVAEVLKRDHVAPRYQTREHVSRVAWRIAHDWLRAQLAIIQAGMASLPEVLFPYALTGSGETTFEQFVQTRKAIGR